MIYTITTTYHNKNTYIKKNKKKENNDGPEINERPKVRRVGSLQTEPGCLKHKTKVNGGNPSSRGRKCLCITLRFPLFSVSHSLNLSQPTKAERNSRDSDRTMLATEALT